MTWASLAAVSGFLAVAAGAFGAHGLKSILDPQSLAVFETAVRYQLWHTLALMLWSIQSKGPSRRVGVCFVVGVFVFSGSLYALALSGVRQLGMITPIGGVFLLTGWLIWALEARSQSSRKR